MKPVFRITALLMAVVFTFGSTDVKAQTPQKFSIKCCIKIGLPQIKLKRPKKDCKSGFGLCIIKPYACIICNFDGTSPDCSKCTSAKALNGADAGNLIYLTGEFDGTNVVFNLSDIIKSSPDFAGETFTTFTLDYDISLLDPDTDLVKYVLKAGEYPVTDNGTKMQFTVPAL